MSSSITIKIKTESPSFQDNPCELADILENIAKRMRKGEGIPLGIQDTQGNTVGHITVTGVRRAP